MPTIKHVQGWLVTKLIAIAAPAKPFITQIEKHSQSIGIAVLVAVLTFITFFPSHAAHAQASFSIDLSGLLATASSLFNQLFPVFAPIIGITLAFAIIAYIINEIRRAI